MKPPCLVERVAHGSPFSEQSVVMLIDVVLRFQG